MSLPTSCWHFATERRDRIEPMTARLICLGNVIVDVTARVASLPPRGGDVIAESGAMVTGGSGFNVMAAAARLGIPTLYAGTHGTGPAGDLARDALTHEGIDIAHTPEPGIDTGWDVALTDAGAERTFVTVVGAESAVSAQHLSTVHAAAGDVVYVSGYGLLADPGRQAILGWLATIPAGVTVVTDPGPLVATIDSGTLSRVRSATTWWSCSGNEAQLLTGVADPAEAAKSLADSGMGVVVRLGAEGCLLVSSGSEPVLIPGYRVDALDTNGAGDAHVGAFIAHLLLEHQPVDAARLANAAAAFSVTHAGPATGPDSRELHHFLG